MVRKTRSYYIGQIDDVVRKIFRLENKNKCVTCGVVRDWYHPIDNPFGITVGHFHSRKFMETRFTKRNLHPQCMECNDLHNRNRKPYEDYMKTQYTDEQLERLEEKTKNFYKASIGDLKEMLAEKKRELRSLETQTKW